MRIKAAIIAAILGAFTLTGCDINTDNKLCTYNTRITNTYLFFIDNESIDRVTDYVFDSNGILIQVSERSKNALHYCELNLGEGNYTLVSWANLGRTTLVTHEEIGKTRLVDMYLTVDAVSKYLNHHTNSEKLYSGMLEFSVGQTGITRTTLLMRRAYASLKMTIKWAHDNERPINSNAFNFRLKQIRGNYPLGNPFSLADAQNVNYATSATMNDLGEIDGEIVSYRYNSNIHQLFRLYNGDTPLTNEIDLTPLFDKLNLNLNTAIRQNYKGSIEINGSNISIILNEELETQL